MKTINSRWLTALAGSALTVCSCALATELPNDLRAAEAAGIRHQLKYAEYYDKVFQPFFYEHVMSRCVQFSFDDKTPFVQILAVDAGGKLMKSYVSAETRVSRCVEEEAAKATFPKPPVEPFFAHFDMRFQKQR